MQNFQIEVLPNHNPHMIRYKPEDQQRDVYADCVIFADAGFVRELIWRCTKRDLLDRAIGFLLEDVGRKFDRRVVTALANYIDNRGSRDSWKSFGEQSEAAEWGDGDARARSGRYLCIRHWQYRWLRPIAPENTRRDLRLRVGKSSVSI